MKEWKDKKSRYTLEEPDSSELKLSNFKLVVHRHIHYPPDKWLASCYGLFYRHELAPKELDQAKIQAKAMLHIILEDSLKELLPEQPTTNHK